MMKVGTRGRHQRCRRTVLGHLQEGCRQHACLSETRKAGGVHLRGAGLEEGGVWVEDPAGVPTGDVRT